MKLADSLPAINPVLEEIREHFGFVPAYFRVAERSPEILEALWVQMRTVRQDSRIPLLVKMKLAAYLATAVSLPYCMISDICELSRLGMSGEEILEWLTQPRFSVSQVEQSLSQFAQFAQVITRWEDLTPEQERLVMQAVLFMYQEPETERAFSRALRRVLSGDLFASLSFFVAYLRSAQSWMEDHPELDPADDHVVWRSFNKVVAKCPEIGVLVEKERRERWKFGFENQRLKEEVEATRKALEAREEFFSIASHELKTPLTSLKLQFELIQKAVRAQVAIPECNHFKRNLELAQVQIHTLTRLIDLLLDLARIKSGRFQLQADNLLLDELVTEVLQRFQEEAKLIGCELIAELESGVIGCWDRTRFEQIITNLLSNALKYGRGKPVIIRAGRIPKQQTCYLEVKDHGIGIAPHDHCRIFERFERAVSEKRFSGLGLGLYITKQLVEAHGGTISVDSRAGDGAVFRIEFPLRPASKVIALTSGTEASMQSLSAPGS